MTHNPLAYLPDEALQDEVERRRLSRMTAWVTVGASVPVEVLINAGHFAYLGDTHSLVPQEEHGTAEVVSLITWLAVQGDNFAAYARVQQEEMG